MNLLCLLTGHRFAFSRLHNPMDPSVMHGPHKGERPPWWEGHYVHFGLVADCTRCHKVINVRAKNLPVKLPDGRLVDKKWCFSLIGQHPDRYYANPPKQDDTKNDE